VNKQVVALEGHLRMCRNVLTLGVRTNFNDYSEHEREAIRKADKIYYPSTFYADLFDAMGKHTFPSYHTYKCVQDKIKQTALFALLEIPHPRTRVFYGKRQKATIGSMFAYPLIAKTARGSAMGRGVYLIRNDAELNAYLESNHPAYIQEYLPIDRDIRVVIIGRSFVHAYWRIAPADDFRSNVSGGGAISFDDVPGQAVDLARQTAQRCGWDNVGVDICTHDGRYYVLEANMKFGRQGFRAAGIDYGKTMETMIENGEI
jgi:ribosomal protein S6--L-glutamate ligase